MQHLKNKTSQWLEHIQSPERQALGGGSPFKSLIFKVKSTDIQSPSGALPTPEYMALNDETAGEEDYPLSVTEGLQTTVNMCRTKSGYDPLDVEGDGTMDRFLDFAEEISLVPYLTLEESAVTNVKQTSEDTDVIIDSFVQAFKGITTADVEAITKSVENLVEAALSYSETTQSESNFTQNILEYDGSGKVLFNLYNSVFEIYVVEDKNTIEYHSEYSLVQASYSLDENIWDIVKDSFTEIFKEAVDDWIASMITPPKDDAKGRTRCLEKSEAEPV